MKIMSLEETLNYFLSPASPKENNQDMIKFPAGY
jgi:hypothetical protein